MKFVIDSAIPFVDGVFEAFGATLYKKGEEITREDVMDADALIIRTRTLCNEKLLSGTRVRMIATATIGTDHIDMEWCTRNGIYVENASGCNADGVMDYVFSALYGVASRKSIKMDGFTMGIIGVGNVGKRVEAMARTLGLNVLLCDPPRAEKEGSEGFCSLDELLSASNAVTLHVPLDSSTRGMADENFFERMLPGTVFINASRGEVVVEDALIEAIPKLGAVILDTWDNEPHINHELLDLVDIATPHIAGYSYQGKQNGTAAAVRAVARFFGLDELKDFFPDTGRKELEPVKLNVSGKSQGEIASLFQYNYPIFTDDFMFRLDPDGFERLRSEYNYRREFYID